MQSVSQVNGNAQFAPVQKADGTGRIAGAHEKREREVTETRNAEPGVDFRHAEVESPGRYWVERSEEGSKIRFERPTAMNDLRDDGKDDSPTRPNAADSQEPAKTQVTVCSTDQVDAEIKSIRNRVSTLEQSLRGEQDETEKAKLDRELQAAKQELAQKDNDMYRRQHARFTNL